MTAELDERELYIRDLVRIKFDEANGDKMKMEKNVVDRKIWNTEKNQSTKFNQLNSKGFTVKNVPVRESRLIDKCKNCKSIKLQNKYDKTLNTRTNFAVNTKSQLSLKNLERIDLYPELSEKSSEKKLRKVCKRADIDRSLIDAAVQTTSLCEIPKTSGVLSEEAKIPVQTNMTITDSQSDKNIGQKPKESFIDFLYHIEELDKNNKINENNAEKLENNSYVNDDSSEFEEVVGVDIEEIILDPPNIETLDKTLMNFDNKMEIIFRSTSELNSLLSIHTNKKIFENKSNKSRNIVNKVKFILKPRKRISSCESSESSETFYPPAKFSTPLIKSKNTDTSVQAELKIKSSSDNEIEGLFIPVTDSIIKNNPSKVLTMKNTMNSIEKNIEIIEKEINLCNINENLITIDNEDNKDENVDTNGTSLPSYSNDSIHESLNSDNSQKQLNSKIDCVNGQNKINIVVDNTSAIENKNEEMCKVVSLQVNAQNSQAENDNKRDLTNLEKINPTPGSSLNDRTSFDVSGIYSESFEDSVTELKSASCEVNKHDNKSKNFDENIIPNVQIIDNEKYEKSTETLTNNLNENKINPSISNDTEKSENNIVSNVTKKSHSTDKQVSEIFLINQQTVVTSASSSLSTKLSTKSKSNEAKVNLLNFNKL